MIVGAGPVGLTLALDLGRRGVRCMLNERKEAPQRLPKMERCNARSMEIFRRMGMAERFRGFLPVVVDVETGGFNAQTDALLEIAAVILGMDENGPVEVRPPAGSGGQLPDPRRAR